MLVHLTASGKEHMDRGYKTISDVLSLSRNVGDSEATDIVCEDFLSSFELQDVSKVLNLIVQKMRIGAKLTICEKDFNLISLIISRESVELSALNAAVFEDKYAIRSMLTLELIESLLKEHELKLISKGFETISFTLVLQRIK